MAQARGDSPKFFHSVLDQIASMVAAIDPKKVAPVRGDRTPTDTVLVERVSDYLICVHGLHAKLVAEANSLHSRIESLTDSIGDVLGDAMRGRMGGGRTSAMIDAIYAQADVQRQNAIDLAQAEADYEAKGEMISFVGDLFWMELRRLHPDLYKAEGLTLRSDWSVVEQKRSDDIASKLRGALFGSGSLGPFIGGGFGLEDAFPFMSGKAGDFGRPAGFTNVFEDIFGKGGRRDLKEVDVAALPEELKKVLETSGFLKDGKLLRGATLHMGGDMSLSEVAELFRHPNRAAGPGGARQSERAKV